MWYEAWPDRSNAYTYPNEYSGTTNDSVVFSVLSDNSQGWSFNHVDQTGGSGDTVNYTLPSVTYIYYAESVLEAPGLPGGSNAYIFKFTPPVPFTSGVYQSYQSSS